MQNELLVVETISFVSACVNNSSQTHNSNESFTAKVSFVQKDRLLFPVLIPEVLLCARAALRMRSVAAHGVTILYVHSTAGAVTTT